MAIWSSFNNEFDNSDVEGSTTTIADTVARCNFRSGGIAGAPGPSRVGADCARVVSGLPPRLSGQRP